MNLHRLDEELGFGPVAMRREQRRKALEARRAAQDLAESIHRESQASTGLPDEFHYASVEDLSIAIRWIIEQTDDEAAAHTSH